MIDLLDTLISTPSTSRDEGGTADAIEQWLANKGVAANRCHNNVFALSAHYDPALPTVLLNSHHDTVKPSPAYTFDPYTPIHRDGKIYGLGSNDAGGSVVALATVFADLYRQRLPYNLLLALSAEEEVSGEKGIRALLPHLDDLGIRIDMGIVGEPTSMQAAIAERGLVVLDGTARGRTGHAARNEGVNALYIAVDDIRALRNFRFPQVSPVLGDIKVTVTQIQAGRQHNVVPELCSFVVDVRTTDAYSNEQTAAMLQSIVQSDLVPRSTRIRASVIDTAHPLVVAARNIGAAPYVSPTTSDMALMHDFPTLKIGPGDSARSHTADEFIYENEITDAIDGYHRMLRLLTI